jgi:hypothetical protein
MPVNEEQLDQSLKFLIANALSDSLTLGLSDGLGAAVIHTNSSIPRKLKLSIANTLPVEVRIVGQPGPASPSNFHFHIQFVNNQCFTSPPPLTLTTPKWAINTVSNGASFITDIYLLSTATISLEPTSSAGSAGHTTEVELLYTEAMLNNVTVEVLLVAVKVGQKVVAIINSNPQPIIETETIHLTTFTDAGAPTPLIATLVQPRTILNDGTTTSQLLLRLVNTSPDPVTFAPPPVANSPTPTAVQLSVDLDEAAAWALCKADEAGSIVVTPPAHWTGVHEGVIGTGRKTKTWLFRPVYTETNRIEHNSSLEFLICGVKSSLPPGFTNLYVTLQEFPNYGTQTAVAQIEKSPIIYNRGLVGIGTNQPKSTLSVKGGAAVGATYANSVAAPNGLIVEGNVGIGVSDPAAKLHVGSGAIQIGTEADSITLIYSSITHKYGTQENPRYTIDRDLLGNGNAGIGFGPGVESIQKSGSAVGIPTNNALAFYTSGGGNLAERVRIDSFGNVGIGTNEPKSTLSVKGGAAVGSTYAETDVAPPNSLLVEGNVGIGTNQPRSTLSVKGGAAVGATYANRVAAPNVLIVEGNIGIGTNEPKSTLSVKGGAAVGSTYAETDVAPPNSLLVEGNVGIGTPSPKQKLEVAGNIKMSGQRTKLFYRGDNDSHVGSLAFYSPDGGKTAIITPYDGVGGDLLTSTIRLGGFGNFESNQVSLAVNGNVGIGTTTPTKAALVVEGSVSRNNLTGNFGLLTQYGAYYYSHTMEGARDVSIYASSLIWSGQWCIASSDERIKRIQGLSDGAEDLNKLLGIEVTDYTYIDTVSTGTNTHKKVIAQQVLKVFPQAVSEATNVVPDIYQKAAVRDGWVQLATNLKKGERVRLIGEKNEGIHEVLEVGEGQFRTDFATEGQQVFVYGREVDDFLNVDYDAIAMLNVSATQQIKREKDAEVQALREENDALRARLDRLENVIKSLVSPGSLLGSDPLEENAPLKLMI